MSTKKNSTSPKKSKSTSRKNKSSTKNVNKKSNNPLTLSIINKISPLVEELNEASEYDYDKTETDQFFSSLSAEEKSSLFLYQDSSMKINNFHRIGYDTFSELKLKKDDNYEGNDYDDNYEYKNFFDKDDDDDDHVKKDFKDYVYSFLDEIDSIDNAFTNNNCPKTTKKTILFRGTEENFTNEGNIEKSYISTTKTLEALFYMISKGDNVLSKDCCINILILDHNIPYIDLESIVERWSYQKEVLLPRGLKSEIINESDFEHNNSIFKVYIKKISLKNNDKYKLPNIQKYDGIDAKILNFFFNKQRLEIIKLSKMFLDNNDWTDEKEDFYDLLEYLYDLYNKGIIYICTKKRYNKLCKHILDTLKNIVTEMIKSNIVKDNCKPKLKKTLKTINKILKTKEQIITPKKFIEVIDC